MSSTPKWVPLPPDSKDYFLVYLWGMLWAIVYFLLPPVTTLSFLAHVVIAVWCGVSVVGAFLAILGLLTRDNLLLERLGVTILMVAPGTYAITQLGLFITGFFIQLSTDPFGRFHLVFLALWAFFFLNKRRRQIKRKVAEAKATPLESEGGIL